MACLWDRINRKNEERDGLGNVKAKENALHLKKTFRFVTFNCHFQIKTEAVQLKCILVCGNQFCICY